MNYLELVNRTIFESGIELDELTSVNFSSTSLDKMYRRFKNFVNDGYKDIQQSRNEWEWKTATATTTIRPRIRVVDGDRPTAPPTGSTFEGDTYGRTITVNTVTTLSGAWASGTANAIIDLDDLTFSDFVFGEVYDEVSPTPANTDVFSIKWWGEYDLLAGIGSGAELNKGSVYIQYVDSSERRRLSFVSWEEFQNLANNSTNVVGEPIAFTETASGLFDFYPRPQKEFRVFFDYATPIQTLTDFDDIPDLPVEYHEAILWKALMYYADFDEKPQVFARAERRYMTLANVLEFNKLPTIQWGPNAYDATEF